MIKLQHIDSLRTLKRFSVALMAGLLWSPYVLAQGIVVEDLPPLNNQAEAEQQPQNQDAQPLPENQNLDPSLQIQNGVQASEGEEIAPPVKIKNEVAVFSGLDKITGRIIRFDVKVDETVQFGALQVTPRICYTRPATEAPQTTSFVKVDEVTLDRKVQPLFNGWMFAASPGLHAVEHAVYDVWLTDCKSGDQFSEQPITTSNDDLGGRGFGDVASADVPATDEGEGVAPPIPGINPLRNN